MGEKISGVVIGGNKFGRRLGFPTANIAVDPSWPMKDGVYAAQAVVECVQYDGMAYLGHKPSVGGDGKRVLEINLFDFEGDLYGKTIEIRLLEFMRGEETMTSFDALRARLAEDRRIITEYFKTR